MSIKEIIDIITTSIVAAAAIIALYLTTKQIKLSNRQYLFKQRLEIIMIIEELIELQKNSGLSDALNKKDDGYFDAEFLFTELTNNSLLYEITPIVNDVHNQQNRVAVLKKLEYLKKLSRETYFIFNDGNKKEQTIIKEKLSNYILSYHNLLKSCYQCVVVNNKINEINKKSNNKYEYKEIQKQTGELKYRNNLKNDIKSILNECSEIDNEEFKKRLEKYVKI